MHPLSANDILQIWEWGRDKHSIDRALAVLGRAYPELTSVQLQTLTIGQRNGRLLSLREKMLGSTLKGFANCPQCGLALEFSVDIGVIQRPEPAAQTFNLRVGNLSLHFRPLNSLDLTAIVGLVEISAARLRLLEHCLLEATQAGQALVAADLPETALAALLDALSECDPQAETRFQLTCVDCGHHWSALFDIVPFFWSELSARAERLLGEVHTLARAYGWREADILEMSEMRRHTYLELMS